MLRGEGDLDGVATNNIQNKKALKFSSRVYKRRDKLTFCLGEDRIKKC